MAEPLLSRMPSPAYDNVTDNVLSRKMKPLPKRRRVSDILFDANDIAATQAFLAAAAAASEQGHEDLNFPGNLPGSLSDYYMPLLAGMQDILRADLKYASTSPSTQPQAQLPLPALPVPPPPKEDEDHNEYVDHLEQPGNTKKRKVPLVRQTGYPADFIGDPEIPEGELQNVDRRTSPSLHEMEQKPRPPDKPSQQGEVVPVRKTNMSKATQAWLSNKEMLKSRKRQLTAVLGTMYNGDSPALDHALSSVQPFAKVISGSNKEDARVRLSRRVHRVLIRRAAKANSKAPATQSKFTGKGFTFSVLCATSERLAAMRDEVATLSAKFEKEWSAQSARNAEAAKRAARKAANIPGSDTPITSGGKLKGGTKKKKRSALANASNPHHLRNYVPSRLPNSGPPPSANAAAANQQTFISPLALRFLSAQLAPRRHRGANAGDPGRLTTATSQLMSPGEEWICPLCEYDLFYGNEARFHRAVRNRKKILKRRRRAREKAAATASGTKGAARAPTSSQGDEDAGSDEVESVKTRGSEAGDGVQGVGGGGGGRLRAPG